LPARRLRRASGSAMLTANSKRRAGPPPSRRTRPQVMRTVRRLGTHMRKLCVSAILIFTAACTFEPGSGVALDELISRWKAQFSVHGQVLSVEVENPGGFNLASVSPLYRDGKVILSGQFISSGGRRRQVLQVDLSAIAREKGWESRIYWANPDSTLS